jgi:hypothetical protein
MLRAGGWLPLEAQSRATTNCCPATTLKMLHPHVCAADDAGRGFCRSTVELVPDRSPGPAQIYREANLVLVPDSPRQVSRTTSPPYARACFSTGCHRRACGHFQVFRARQRRGTEPQEAPPARLGYRLADLTLSPLFLRDRLTVPTGKPSPTRPGTIPSGGDIAPESWAALLGIGALRVSHTFSLTVCPLCRKSRAPRVYADILACTNLLRSGRHWGWGWGWGWPRGAQGDTQAFVGVPVSRTTVSDRTTLRDSDIRRSWIDLRRTGRNAVRAHGQCPANILRCMCVRQTSYRQNCSHSELFHSPSSGLFENHPSSHKRGECGTPEVYNEIDASSAAVGTEAARNSNTSQPYPDYPRLRTGDVMTGFESNSDARPSASRSAVLRSRQLRIIKARRRRMGGVYVFTKLQGGQRH